MKKKLAVILAMSLTLGLTACGSTAGSEAAGEKQEAVTEEKKETAAESKDAAAESTSSAAEEGSAAAGNQEAPTELVWWTYFGDANIGYLQTVIDAFNESQSDYHVTIEFQGKQAEMNAKIQSTAQADLPALFSGAVENVAMYANADYCVPLQTYLDKDTAGWAELDTTWDAIRSAYCDNEGNQIGYPIGYSYPGIYYNADMLKEAGVDPAEIRSFEDLYNACKTLVDGGYTTYGIGFHPDGFYFNAALGREGIQAYNNNNGLGSEPITECLYESDQQVHDAVSQMLRVYQELHADNYCIPYGTDYQAEIIPQLASGDCAMMMGVVSMTTKVLEAVNGSFEVGIIPMISATENGKCSGEPAGGTGTYIGNNGDEKQMQGAYEFIKFASTGDQAAYFATQTGYLAPNQESFDSEEYQNYVKNVFPAVTRIYESLKASDDSAVNPYIPISNEMKEANKLAIETVAADPAADIEEVIQTAQESIQEAIELYNASNQ